MSTPHTHPPPHATNSKRVVRLPCCVCKQVIDIEYCEFEKVAGCPLAPAPIDTSFQFKCEACEGGACFFSHSAKNWSQLLATAMYNMHQRQDRFDYLFTDKILDFIEAHPDILKPILGKNDMRTRLARALREHRESFESLMARSGQYKLKRMTYDDIQPRTNISSSSIHSNTISSSTAPPPAATTTTTTTPTPPTIAASPKVTKASTPYFSTTFNANFKTLPTAVPPTSNNIVPPLSSHSTTTNPSAKLPSLSTVIGSMSHNPLPERPQVPDQHPALLSPAPPIDEYLYLGRFPLYYDPLPRSATCIVAWLECTQCGKINKTDCNNLRGDNEEIKFMIPGPGDNEYNYWCPDCSQYEIFYHHNNKSWQAIMATAMYNLERFHGRQYFSLDDGLFPFIETHWQVLCNGKSRLENWKETCRNVIVDKAHAQVFTNKDGYWALRCDDVIPNIKNRLRVEKIVSRRKTGIAEECQVKWAGLADTFNTWITATQIVVPTKAPPVISNPSNSSFLNTSNPQVPWFNESVFAPPPPAPKPRALGTVSIKSPVEITDNPLHSLIDDIESEPLIENVTPVPCPPPDQFMQCSKCMQIIEIDLSNAKNDPTIYPGPHDTNYTYTCSSCTGGKSEIIHLKKTSLEFLSTALQNLRIKKGYNEFHLNDIYVWSTENFHLLRTSIAATADSWKSNFRWVLSHNPDKFQSTQRGCWGLKIDQPSAVSATKSTPPASSAGDVRDLPSIKSLTAEAKALLPSAKMPPNKVPPAPRWPTPYPLTSEWQAPPQNYMRQYENCSTIQRGPYELKPSEYFMPSYSPYPEWIASSMMTGTNLKRKYPFPPPPMANTTPCCEGPMEKKPAKGVQHTTCAAAERTREVFLCSENEKSFVGFVHISLKHSLYELRCKIQNEGVRIGNHDFIFLYKGVPVGREQEKKTFVKDCATERLGKTTVSIREVQPEDPQSMPTTTTTTTSHSTQLQQDQTQPESPQVEEVPPPSYATELHLNKEDYMEEGLIRDRRDEKRENKQAMGRMRKGIVRRIDNEKPLNSETEKTPTRGIPEIENLGRVAQSNSEKSQFE